MRPGRRFGLSAEQKIDMWPRWKAGETLPLGLASVAATRAVFLCSLVILLSHSAFGQEVVPRYTICTGFDYMISPARNLTERGIDVDFGVIVKPWRGIDVDFGVIVKPWLGLGGDVSLIGDDIFSGAGTINGSETVYAKPVAALGLDPSLIHVPFRSTTVTTSKWARNFAGPYPGCR